MLHSRIFRSVIAAALIAFVVVLVGFGVAEEVRNAGRLVGIGVEEVDGGISITRVSPGSAAAAAGVVAQDVLVAVAGRPVRSIADYDNQARFFTSGVPVVFTILRDGVRLDLPVSPGRAVEWFRIAVSRLAVVGYLMVGLIAWWQRSTDLRARLLFLFAIAVAFELAMPPVVFRSRALAAAAQALFLALSGFEMGVELHLASVIPRRPEWLSKRPWIVSLYYLAGFGFAAASGVVVAAEIFGVAVVPVTTADLYWVLNTIVLPGWCLAIPLLLTAQAFGYPEPDGRHQAGLVLVGVLPWTLFTLVNTFFPIALANSLGWFVDPLQSLALLCYPIAIFSAMFRYHLFDIELVVRRGLVYSGLTVMLVVLFYLFVGAGGTVLSTIASETSSVWVVSAATLMLGLLFSPLRGFVQEQVDRRVFPERYALRQRLITLAEDLPTLGNLPKMGVHLVAKLEAIFAVKSVTLLIGDPETGVLSVLASSQGGVKARGKDSLLVAPEEPAVAALKLARRPLPLSGLPRSSTALVDRLEQRGVEWVAPVATQRRLIALLFLGGREDSRRFPAEELEMLSLFSHLVATSFENARLFESVKTEALTGLLRRETVIERLGDELNRAQRYHRPLTVGMGDLDHFKLVNDSHGHLSGDAVLRQVAETISRSLRGTDFIGRYGGEEFLVVLPETTRGDAVAVAEKIRQAVADLDAQTQDGGIVKLTISIGLASLDELEGSPENATTELIALADKNLYGAKRQGRNRVEPAPQAV